MFTLFFEEVALHLLHDPFGNLPDLPIVAVRSPYNDVSLVGSEG
jgi:hypothetical protein